MTERKKILVVEDDDVARELMRLTLERLDYEVVTAENGMRGYDEAVSQVPDLVITDVNMPAADGVHLIRRLRTTPELARTSVLVTTGYGTGNATLSLAQGADAYEPKPIDPKSLVATVKRLLDSQTEASIIDE